MEKISMKKTLLTLAMTSCIAFFSTGCTPNTPAGGANPGGGGTGSSFTTRADFIKFANCIKANASVSPESKAAVDAWIAAVNSIPDAQWAAVAAVYNGYAQAYLAMGCR
jgi:hypothetical protein